MPATLNNNKHRVKHRFKNFDLTNNHKLVFTARRGVKSKVFFDFAETIKMPEKDLAKILNISTRTIANYDKQQKTLEPLQSEHLLKLITLFDKGEETFGSVDEFNYWLRKPFWNSKETPMDWIITHGGVDLIINELDRLAKGYPV
jgi:putative toxin-antitoxin system antitoxin component (TIGR02293 family)